MPNRNGLVHEGIIDTLRFNLPTIFENRFEHFFCIADEGLMAAMCNAGNGKGIRPDLFLHCCGTDTLPILIEVGTLNPKKWAGIDNALIHISHNKAVGLISGQNTEIVLEVLLEIRKLLNVV
jgi:hypothetical protein